MDISKLTPAPWKADGGDAKAAGLTVRIYVDGSHLDHAEFIALARNAFDVAMRRGWWAICDSEKWFVRGPGTGPYLYHNDQPWPDPLTALVEADKWYVDNCDPE